MRDVDVVLVRPPYRQSEFDEISQEALGLGMVARSMRDAGLDVTIIDAEMTDLEADDVLITLAGLRPVLVGMTVISQGSLAGALDIAAGVKRWAAPDAHVTLGGIFASFAAAEILQTAPDIDSIVLFEGEIAGSRLAQSLVHESDWRGTPGIALRDGGTVRVNAHPAPVALDDLPPAARDCLPAILEKGRACSVLSSRGCGGRCAFCSSQVAVRASGRSRWTARSVPGLVDELASLHDGFGLREVVFVDDDFIGDRDGGRTRALSFAREMERRGLDLWFAVETRPDLIDRGLFETLHQAGLQSVFMGIESIAPRAQALFRKPLLRSDIERALEVCDELGIVVHAGYIMFHPYSDLDELASSHAFLRAAGQANPHSLTNSLHVAPGTALLPELQTAGLASGDPILGYTCGFADEKVARLHALAVVCVRPLFPNWYRLLRHRARSLTRLRDSGTAADRQSRARGECAVRAIEEVASAAFEQALGCVREGGPDLIGRGIEIRERALAAAEEIESQAVCPAVRGGKKPAIAPTGVPREVGHVA
jgi:anaerobic magnesium-protoporphyrin IX monomethyl ester cyclase